MPGYRPDIAGWVDPTTAAILRRNLDAISHELSRKASTAAILGGGLNSAPASGGGGGGGSGTNIFNWIEFTGTAPTTESEGMFWYDSSTKTFCGKTDYADSTMNFGEELWARIVNKTGSDLADGKAVYVSGAQGNRPTAALASNTSETAANNLIGLLTQATTNNNEGPVTTFGIVHGYDTSGFTAGNALYLGTNGALLDAMPDPTGTDLIIHVGYALNSTNNGQVLVAPRALSHLAYLHDVLDGTPTADYFLKGNGTRWSKFNLFGTANTWTGAQTITGTSGDLLYLSDSNEYYTAIRIESTSSQKTYLLAVGGSSSGYGVGSFFVFDNSTSKPRFILSSTGFQLLSSSGNDLLSGSSAGGGSLSTPITTMSWSGNPTHSGNHTFSGSITANGSVALGDATSDLVTGSARWQRNIDPSATNTYALGQDSLRWSAVHATEFYLNGSALSTTLAGYLPLTGGTITGNLTIGDAATDKLTVNAAPTFAANTFTFSSVTTTISGGLSFSNACTFTDTPRISMAEPYLRIRDTDAATGGTTAGYVQWLNSADVEVAYFGRKGSDTSGLHRWYNAAGNMEIQPAGGLLTVTGAISVTGNSTFGDAASDTCTVNALMTTKGRKVAVTTVTGTTHTVATSDDVIRFTGSADCTATLPDASGSGQRYVFKNRGTNSAKLTIAMNTGDTVDGSSTALVLYNNQSVTLVDVADETWEQI